MVLPLVYLSMRKVRVCGDQRPDLTQGFRYEMQNTYSAFNAFFLSHLAEILWNGKDYPGIEAPFLSVHVCVCYSRVCAWCVNAKTSTSVCLCVFAQDICYVNKPGFSLWVRRLLRVSEWSPEFTSYSVVSRLTGPRCLTLLGLEELSVTAPLWVTYS